MNLVGRKLGQLVWTISGCAFAIIVVVGVIAILAGWTTIGRIPH